MGITNHQHPGGALTEFGLYLFFDRLKLLGDHGQQALINGGLSGNGQVGLDISQLAGQIVLEASWISLVDGQVISLFVSHQARQGQTQRPNCGQSARG